MKKRLLATFLAFVLIASFMPLALAADDTTPPVLHGVTLNKAAFNRGDTLTVTVTATEAESGFDFERCIIYFYLAPDDSGMSLDDLSIKLDTVCETGVQGSILLDEKTGGTYKLSAVYLYDNRGNENDGYYEQLTNVSFTLNSDYTKPKPPNPEPPSPKVTEITFSKKTAYVGDTVNYTLTASDPSGVVSARMQLKPVRVPWYYEPFNVTLKPVTGKPGVFSGSLKITASMPQTDYYPYNIVVVSGSGKTRTIYGLPDSGETEFAILKISNPNLVVSGTDCPILTSVSISNHQAVQGSTIAVTATLDNKSPEFHHLNCSAINLDTGNVSDFHFSIQHQSDGKYSGTVNIPLNLRNGVYALSSFSAFFANGNGGTVCISSSIKAFSSKSIHAKGSEITVNPVLTVSGTVNKTVLAGSAFDPMQGVSARNAYTGDITGKIEVVGGNIDTGKPGMYLVKYIVKDTVSVNGEESSVSYTDYRWIGVSEILPEAPASNSQTPLAVTSGMLTIGANNDEATLKKDGSSISFSGEVTAPGVYTLTCAPGVQLSTGVQASAAKTVSAVIDHTGPVVKAACNKTTKGLSITLKASDVSGVSEIKYMAGAFSLDACKGGGTVYTRAFNIPRFGKYTVYSRDKLGNESVKVLNINSTSANSAYLEGIILSEGSLSRTFSKTVYSYKVQLGEHAGSVTIKPVAEWDGATIAIRGKAASSATVSVANGKSTTVAIKVTFGKSTRTYKLTITRAKSTNNKLKSLTASAGAFNKPFDPAVTSYTLALNESTKSVKIHAAAAAPARATFTGNTIALNPGQTKVVKIKVRAQSGSTRIYTITIVRAKSTDAGLKSIKTNSAKLKLTPAFHSSVTDYTVTMPVATSSVTLTLKANGYKATVTMDGAKRTLKKVTLKRGQSVVVRVVVVSQAGNKREYNITVTRP